MKKYFITGISTEVGKTIAAAIEHKSKDIAYWDPTLAWKQIKADQKFV